MMLQNRGGRSDPIGQEEQESLLRFETDSFRPPPANNQVVVLPLHFRAGQDRTTSIHTVVDDDDVDDDDDSQDREMLDRVARAQQTCQARKRCTIFVLIIYMVLALFFVWRRHHR